MVRLSTQRVRERESGAKKMDESRARDRHDLLSDGSWAGGLVKLSISSDQDDLIRLSGSQSTYYCVYCVRKGFVCAFSSARPSANCLAVTFLRLTSPNHSTSENSPRFSMIDPDIYPPSH